MDLAVEAHDAPVAQPDPVAVGGQGDLEGHAERAGAVDGLQGVVLQQGAGGIAGVEPVDLEHEPGAGDGGEVGAVEPGGQGGDPDVAAWAQAIEPGGVLGQAAGGQIQVEVHGGDRAQRVEHGGEGGGQIDALGRHGDAHGAHDGGVEIGSPDADDPRLVPDPGHLVGEHAQVVQIMASDGLVHGRGPDPLPDIGALGQRLGDVGHGGGARADEGSDEHEQRAAGAVERSDRHGGEAGRREGACGGDRRKDGKRSVAGLDGPGAHAISPGRSPDPAHGAGRSATLPAHASSQQEDP